MAYARFMFKCDPNQWLPVSDDEDKNDRKYRMLDTTCRLNNSNLITFILYNLKMFKNKQLKKNLFRFFVGFDVKVKV